ncbi:hypothetical protein chiPu_0022203 [Chiloscyllium punctatum]|uniref:Uncharacterized protein n=1 Tax=Chiloscyllium punctatum TaxID=137246 RepID=A0A401RE20_CHIPU|nr:hypothetical protein [Chiloscyllium punctatum]
MDSFSRMAPVSHQNNVTVTITASGTQPATSFTRIPAITAHACLETWFVAIFPVQWTVHGAAGHRGVPAVEAVTLDPEGDSDHPQTLLQHWVGESVRVT